MKTENECFFSISLENGITITGQNPQIVLDYLYDTHSAYFELSNSYKAQKTNSLARKYIDRMFEIGHAIDTINANYKQS